MGKINSGYSDRQRLSRHTLENGVVVPVRVVSILSLGKFAGGGLLLVEGVQ